MFVVVEGSNLPQTRRSLRADASSWELETDFTRKARARATGEISKP